MSAESKSLLSDYDRSFSFSSTVSTMEESELGPEHCLICFERIDMNVDFYGMLEHKDSKVQHSEQMFHLDCIRPWIAQKGACPQCWEKMTVQSILTNWTEPTDEEVGIIPIEDPVPLVLVHPNRRKLTRWSRIIGALSAFICFGLVIYLIIRTFTS